MTLDLDELKLIAQAATPGPWKSDVWIETDGYGWRATGPHHEDNIDPMGSETGCPEEQAAQRDAAHIAAFSPDVVLALIAEIQRLRRFDDPQWLATLVAERDAALSRAESAERERDGFKRIVDHNERHPRAPERCPDCKWCNTHLMNYGTPQHWGDGRLVEANSIWLCHGCAARRIQERETVSAIAAWCDRMGWDHTADLIRDGEYRKEGK